mgnify:CR=1 FL=1
MSQKKQVTFEECMQNIQTYIKRPENIELIQRAYDFAYKHHEGSFVKVENHMLSMLSRLQYIGVITLWTKNYCGRLAA